MKQTNSNNKIKFRFGYLLGLFLLLLAVAAVYLTIVTSAAGAQLSHLEKEREKRGGRKPSVKSLGGLEGKLPAVIAISGLVLSLFFLSGITGNVTGLNNSTQSFLGVVLFVIGVISAVWYFKRK